jgi:prephenate dehydrogenase
VTQLRVAVLGVGLIGGSIGLAARARAGAHVVGYDPDASALSRALEIGAIDETASEIADAVADVEVVYVAAPIGTATQTARLALDAAGAECALSDVGSTKREIVRAIGDPRFVGGHPLAGAETAGVGNAREDLFDGATWYLTPACGAAGPVAGASSPGAETAGWAVERLRGLIESFGARPVAIDPEAHDRLMASVSHLPHVLANVLVAQASRVLESDGMTVKDGALGAGPSFRDATRVAGANTAIWTDIYMSNGDLLAPALDAAIEELNTVRDALCAGDAEALTAWNERARAELERLTKRGAFGAGVGPAPDS